MSQCVVNTHVRSLGQYLSVWFT